MEQDAAAGPSSGGDRLDPPTHPPPVVPLPPTPFLFYGGLIKRHPSDFLVREVDVDGHTADITTPPVLPPSWARLVGITKGACVVQDTTTTPSAASSTTASSATCLTPEGLRNLLGADVYEALEKLHQLHVMGALQLDKEIPLHEDDLMHLPLPKDREARGVLHRSLKATFPGITTRQEEATGKLWVAPDAPILETAKQVLAQDGVELGQVRDLLILFARGRNDAEAKKSGGVVLGPLDDKAARTAVHRLIANANAFVALQTSTRDNGCVHVTWKESKKRQRSGGHEEGPFLLRMVVRKENMEHLEAMQRVSRALGLSPTSAIGCAGIKDKRAITYQFLTVKVERTAVALDAVRRGFEQLAVNNGGGGGVQVGNVEDWGAAPRQHLQTGESRGNAFTLVVRDLYPLVESRRSSTHHHQDDDDAMRQDLEARLCKLRDRGTVNYFGVQRVGGQRDREASGRGGTVGQPHELGRALLLQDYEAFTKLFLGIRNDKDNKESSAAADDDDDDGHDNIQAAKAMFWDGQTPLSTILKKLPASMAREKLFVQALQKHGRDQVAKALCALPYGVRMQWVHAYQSMLWNRVATWRIQQYGHKAVVGDLVLVAKADREERSRPTVRTLTADDFQKKGAAEALMHEVVLPLMGHDVRLPDNETKEAYRQVLEEEGVWTLFTNDNNNKQNKESRAIIGNLKGTYRRLWVTPESLTWTFLSPSSSPPPVSTTGEEVEKEETSAVKLRFSLPPGSFATVVVHALLGKEPVSYSCKRGKRNM